MAAASGGALHPEKFRGSLKAASGYLREVPNRFSKLCGQKETFTRAGFLKLVKERIDQLDVPFAIEDIIYFVRD